MGELYIFTITITLVKFFLMKYNNVPKLKNQSDLHIFFANVPKIVNPKIEELNSRVNNFPKTYSRLLESSLWIFGYLRRNSEDKKI